MMRSAGAIYPSDLRQNNSKKKRKSHSDVSVEVLLRRVSLSVLPISFGSVYRVTHTHRHIHRGRKNTVKKIRDTLPGGGSEVHFILSPVRCQQEDAYQNTISGDRKDHSVIAL